jgi:hypothetical protein
MPRRKQTADDTAGAEATKDYPANEDVVEMASVRKDGTPDQSAGFQFLDPEKGQELLGLQQQSVGDAEHDYVIGAREDKRNQ